VTWSLAWIPFGALWGLGDWLLFPDSTPLSYLLVTSTALFAGAGFAGGVIFSLVLSRIEGRRGFSQLTVPRFLGWGALGGVLLSALLLLSNGVSQLSLADLIALVTLPLLGAGSAAGSLVIARSAEDRELLAPPGDVDEPELSEEGRVELLGSA
jgi:uncharacterized membrane protein YcaP (DUF421 family)